MQIILDADVLNVSLNGRGGGGNATTNDRMMGFGSIALYAGGTGEVTFKEIGYKDLNTKFEPQETVSSNFRMQRLNDFYYGWCAAAADFNHHGPSDLHVPQLDGCVRHTSPSDLVEPAQQRIDQLLQDDQPEDGRDRRQVERADHRDDPPPEARDTD